MSRQIVKLLMFWSVFSAALSVAAQSSSDLIEVTQEMARVLEGTNWIGNSGVFLSSKSNVGIQNSSSMVFGFSDGQLYYLSKINPVLDNLINKGAGGLCVKSEPRRVEFFKENSSGKLSGVVYVPKISKKTGVKSYAKIRLEHVKLSEDKSHLEILDWEITSKNGRKVFIPTRYDLQKVDLDKIEAPEADSKEKPTSAQIAKILRAQIDECLRVKPWLK